MEYRPSTRIGVGPPAKGPKSPSLLRLKTFRNPGNKNFTQFAVDIVWEACSPKGEKHVQLVVPWVRHQPFRRAARIAF